MTRIDRYLLINFLRIFLISLISLTGMYMVIHLFTNLDELLSLATEERPLLRVMANFYGPRSLDFFDRTVGILMLMSGVFTLAMMQRKHEMAAVEAAGITRLRLLRPIVVASIVLVALSVINREVVIPQYREELLATAQNWRESPEERQPTFHKDHIHGFLISTSDVEKESGVVTLPVVQLPIHVSRTISRLSGKKGRWMPASNFHPAGLVIEKLEQAGEISAHPDLLVGDQAVVFFSNSNDWLQKDECLVATTLDLNELALGDLVSQYTSLTEMIATLRRPSQWYSQGNRIAVHSRIVRPVIDLSLLLVALPLVLNFTDRNLFFAAMICVGVTGLFSLVIVGSQLLGNFSIIHPPALSAWLPVIIFAPLSVLTARLMLR